MKKSRIFSVSIQMMTNLSYFNFDVTVIGVKMRINLDPAELKWLLIDSLKRYSENVIYITGENPYEFTVNRKLIWLFIRNIHDSGSGRTNPDESRIQVSKTPKFEEVLSSNIPIVFLGYDSEYHVFTAWDPILQRDRLNQRQNVSLYSRFSSQQNALNQGVAVYKDNDGQVVISFQTEYLGLYIDNYQQMHSSNETELLELVSSSNRISETENEVGETIEIGRKKYIVTHQTYPRDYRFTRTIKSLYDDSCAMCGMQLELVEAAHIIPHGHELGSDELNNGLCLCILHHGAFDHGLIFVDSRYKILRNDEKFIYLDKINKRFGEERLLSKIYEKIKLPQNERNYPSPEKISISNEIRGIQVS
ncbi:HNH endonuclease [Chloroflexota bacterium]